MKKEIVPLRHYPDNGDHQECFIGYFPFRITKGQDGYYYHDKNGNEKKYNLYKSGKIDKRWIVHLNEHCEYSNRNKNPSLDKIFEVKVNKNLDKIVEYCMAIYKKSLEMEIVRIAKELKGLDINND